MSKKLKKSIITLMIFLVLIISISTISATDNDSINETLTENADSQTLEISHDNEIIKDGENKTFSQLNTEITNNNILNLDSNYVYTSTDSAYANGISIDKEITINGNGNIINPNGNLLFKIGTNGQVTLNNVKIINNYTKTDAMIQNNGNLKLNNVTLTVERHIQNAGTYETIKNNGELTIKNSTFRDSYIHSISLTSKNIYIYGLIYNTNKTTIENTIFDNNKVYNPQSIKLGKLIKVIAILYNAKEMTLNNITIQNTNVSYTKYSGTYHFEGIIHNENAKLTINGSTFKNNSMKFYESNNYLKGIIYSKDTGSTLNITNSIITNNTNIQLLDGTKSSNISLIEYGRSANLNNNYWGTNNPKFNEIITGTAPDNFVILGFTPENATAGVEKTYQLTLNTVNASGVISTLETGTLPAYNVNVKSRNLGEQNVEIKNGVGQYNYFATTPGNDIITINDEKYNITINGVEKATFTKLQELIDNNIEIDLYKNYTYDSNEDTSLKAGIKINKEITINGNGYTINSTSEAQLFNIESTGKLILKNVTLITDLVVAKSATSNGNIINKGEVIFENIIFTSNRIWKTGTMFASAIYTEGTLTIKNSEFKDNLAKYTGTTASPYGLIYNKGNLNIENTLFKNNGIYTTGTSATITGLIYNNKNLKLENTSFENNYIIHNNTNALTSTLNGIIYAPQNTQSNITINNSTFKENRLISIIKEGKTQNIYGTLYIKSGTINITNTNFIKNSAKTGAAITIYPTTGSLTLISKNNSYIENNALNDGGAIYIYQNSILNSENDKFINNTAVNGGAIYGKTNNANIANITVKNSIFEYNTATIGSAIYITNKTYVNNNYWGSNNPNFNELLSNETNNLIPENHIIIKIEGKNILTPESKETYTISFKSNESDAIYELPEYTVKLTATNKLSTNNVKLIKGQGLITYEAGEDELNDTIKVTVNSQEITTFNITIQENSSEEGSYKGLSKEIRKSEGELNLTKNYTYNSEKDKGYENGIVINKTITINGNGHMINSTSLAKLFNVTSTGNLTLKNIIIVSDYVKTGSNSNNVRSEASFKNSGNVVLDNVTFTINQNINNSSTYLASGIYNTNNFEIINSKFINSNITTNTQYYYGLIDNNAGTLTIKNTIFENNTLTDYTTMSNLNINGLIHNTANLILNNINVINNNMKTPANSNGLIRTDVNGKTNIKNSLFENNTLTSTGNMINGQGTVLYADAGSLTIEHSRFIKNGGALTGGVIYTRISPTLINNTFEKNTAVENGGAIYLTSTATQSIIINNTFKENKAKFGGAINSDASIQSYANYNFTGNTFIGNEATKNGGALFIRASIGSVKNPIENNIFTNNKALEKGGAIYSTGILRITKSIFNGNIAGEGAAIYTTDISACNISYSIFDNNIAKAKDAPIIYYHGTSYANYNYWGTNNPDFEKIIGKNGGLTINIPTNIVVLSLDGNNTINASTNYTISFKDNVTGDIIKLPEYNFDLTTKINNITPTSITLINGEATIEYDVRNGGLETINVLSNNDEKAQFIINVNLGKSVKADLIVKDSLYSDKLNVLFNVVEGPNGTDIYKWTIFSKNGLVLESGYVENGTITVKNVYNVGNYSIVVSMSNVSGWNDFEINDTFQIIEKETVINPIININNDNTVTIIISIEADGVKVNAGGNITAVIDKSYETIIKNGECIINTGVLSPNTYNITFSYSGDGNYKESVNVTQILIKNIVSENAINITTPEGSATPSYTINLPSNATGNLVVIVNNVTYSEALVNGSATVNVDKLAPGNYSVVIHYTGDNNYNNFTKNTNITVASNTPVKPIPEKTVIVAKNKSFKASKKVKKYSIILKSSTTLVKNVKVTLKIKGKTYHATTNNKGKATFKIKKLSKKGKYKSKISFKGNVSYKACSKTVKIIIK